MCFDDEAQPKKNNTNDVRYQIFISSPFGELAKQRKSAIEVVVDNGHIPVALENSSAAEPSSRETIKKAIETSQIFILILGASYGTEMPDMEPSLSFTEYEYKLAIENKLLILPFIIADDEVTRYYDRLATVGGNENPERVKLAQYQAFRTELCNTHSAKIWSPNEEFKVLIQKALCDNLKNFEGTGFVLSMDNEEENTFKLGIKNKFILNIVKKITSFYKLNERVGRYPKRKEAMSDFFIEKYAHRLIKNEVDLFFESGSTLSFLSSGFIEYLNQYNMRKKIEDGTTNIITNNIIVYLQFLLEANLPCRMFPKGYPEEPYGASYGMIRDLKAKMPTYPSEPLDKAACDAIDTLLKQTTLLNNNNKKILILGATSGLQITNEYNSKHWDHVNKKVDESAELIPVEYRKMIDESLRGCMGPHCGSYHNKVFKRFLYATKKPLMIFMTGDKIDVEILINRCHFMLDGNMSPSDNPNKYDLTWDDFKKDQPLAFCVGCAIEKIDKFVDIFKNEKFYVERGPNTTARTAFIAKNQLFIDEFDAICM